MTDTPQANLAPETGAAPAETVTTTDVNPVPAVDPTTAPPAPETILKDIKGDAPPAGDVVDWRKEYAGDDPKLLKKLERFKTPQDFAKSYQDLEKKMSSGQYKIPLPENATPEQISEWRAQNGIPETPEAYDTTLPDGLVIGEHDKPIVDEFLKAMHGVNATPDVVKAALSAYYANVQQQQAAWVGGSNKVLAATKAELSTEYGADYESNLTQMNNLLASWGDDVKNAFDSARLDDTMLLNNPHVVRALVQSAKTINPTITPVPNTNNNQMQSIESEMKELQSKMGTKSYSETDRARYTQLVEMTQKKG